MDVLFGKDLDVGIRKVCAEKKIRCAVAFWGKGALSLFGELKAKNVKILCNLKSGGTNPYEIEELMGFAEIKQCDNLHAKVYIGKEKAVITSANASANGLGLEDGEQAHWIEAGVMVRGKDELSKISNWFEGHWIDSRVIDKEDIKAAKEAWKNRQQYRPSRLSFLDFVLDENNFPLLSWYGAGKYEPCKDSIEKQIGYFNKKELDHGIEVEHSGDESILIPGRWVLYYDLNIKRNIKPKSIYWVYTGRLVRKAFFYTENKGSKLDCVLAVLKGDPSRPPEPFEITEDFRKSFMKVINRQAYKKLVSDDYDGAWFRDRISLMKGFWKELKEEYHASVSGPAMTKIDMVWVAVARLIYPETDERVVVSKAQIDHMVREMFGVTIPSVLITGHLVNSVARHADRSNPQRGGIRKRYLFRDENGSFRLYKSEDRSSDAWEKTGPTCPDPSDLDATYAPLITWYKDKYFNA